MLPKLYSYFRSSCSYRVRCALEYKGIEYEYIPINLIKEGGEQYQPVYQKLNPEGMVPVLQMGDFVLNQSLAILEYLEEKYPEPPMFPSDINSKAQVRAIMDVIGCDIQPIQNLRVLKYVNKPEWAKYWIEMGFTALEKMLAKTSKKFCFEDQVTLADCVLVPQVYNAIRFEVDMNNFPIISKISKNLNELESFIRAHPDNQPDAPKK